MSENPHDVVTVVASFHVPAPHLETVLAAVGTCARASRQEKGNISYDCRRDRDNPLHFMFVEQWRSLAALQEHERQAHFLALKALFDRELAGSLAVTLLQDVPGLS